MDQESTLAGLLDEQQAIRLVVNFYACLDRGDAAGCAGCFALGGSWERDSGPVTGRVAIEQAAASRNPTRRTTHAVQNFQFQAREDQHATLCFLLLAYDATMEAGDAAPVGRLAGIRHCTDALTKEDGAWRIQRQTSAPWMRGAPT